MRTFTNTMGKQWTFLINSNLMQVFLPYYLINNLIIHLNPIYKQGGQGHS